MIQKEREKVRHLLIVQDGKGKRTVPLEASTYSVGRDASNSIVLSSPSVSRQHATLLRVSVPESEQHIFQVIDGNFKGKKSTNGIFLNGERVSSHSLKAGDTIQFGTKVKAQYYTISDLSDAEFNASCQAENFSDFLADQSSPFDTLIAERQSIESSETAITRLASFPELIPNPIVEIDFAGKISYLNPEALLKFPDLRQLNLEHPVLKDILSLVEESSHKNLFREIEIEESVFEESIHSLPESELIRIFLTDITERKQIELARQVAEKKYRSIFENAIEGIFQITVDGKFIIANPMLARIYGYDSPEELLTGITNIGTQLYVNSRLYQELRQKLQQQREVRGFESQVRCKNGQIIWISENIRTLYDENNQIFGYEGSVVDITERKQAEEELQLRDRLLQAVAEASTHLLTEMDYDIAIQNAIAILGQAAKVDRVCIFENHPHDPSQENAMTMRWEWSKESIPSIIQQPHWQNQPYSTFETANWYERLSNTSSIATLTADLSTTEQELLHRDSIQSLLIVPIWSNSQLWGHLSFQDCHFSRQWSQTEHSILQMIAANIAGAIEREQNEKTMRHRSLHDALTGLSNRRLFDQRLSEALEVANEFGKPLAVMFLDLDRFKVINDTLGHTVGDKLLKQVANRLNSCLTGNDLLSRWGGDEFTILLPEIEDLGDITKTANKFLKAIDSIFEIEGHELFVTVSIGISLYEQPGKSAETLMREADAALYQAKDLGKNQYQFYSNLLGQKIPQLLALEKNLRQALQCQEFSVYYQPRVNLVNGEITGMEALLRWQHPDMGAVSPGVFIPLAEENGLILPIGEWVLRTACLQNKQWQDAGFPPITMAVNLSPRQFRQPNLVTMVTRILEEIGLESKYLELEITEGTAIEDIEFTKSVLEELHQAGIRLSIDDFGTGHSSLNRLQVLPLDCIKIDQSFIRDLGVNAKVSHIIRAIVGLGQHLGLSIVAEGVENQEQLDFLHSIHCESVQGYFFYKPIPATQATEILIEKNKPTD